MTREEARKIVGNQPKWALSNMAHALQLMSYTNTPDEWRRLAALRALGYKVRVKIPWCYLEDDQDLPPECERCGEEALLHEGMCMGCAK